MALSRNILQIIILLNFQPIYAFFSPSHIEIIPKEAIIQSNSTVTFLCINRQNTSKSPLTFSLSKNISSDLVKISVKTINRTTIRAQLRSSNYLGMFHLLCYVQGERSRGNLADIYVKDSPGRIILQPPCLVYDLKYVKCKFYAPTIARAIYNDYNPEFDFIELPSALGHQAYKSRFDFIKNESTNETLVFILRPTSEGVFPNKISMVLEQKLEHFTPTNYTFDISPIFLIIPEFTIKTQRNQKIAINITQLPVSAVCEKSISSDINRTWTSVDLKSSMIITDSCSSNAICRICLKCRREYKDPDGPEVCQEIKPSFFSIPWYLMALTLCLLAAFVLLILIIVIRRLTSFQFQQPINFVLNILRRRRQPSNLNPSTRNSVTANEYNEVELDDMGDLQLADENIIVSDDNLEGTGGYLPIRTSDEIYEVCNPKVLS